MLGCGKGYKAPKRKPFSPAHGSGALNKVKRRGRECAFSRAHYSFSRPITSDLRGVNPPSSLPPPPLLSLRQNTHRHLNRLHIILGRLSPFRIIFCYSTLPVFMAILFSSLFSSSNSVPEKKKGGENKRRKSNSIIRWGSQSTSTFQLKIYFYFFVWFSLCSIQGLSWPLIILFIQLFNVLKSYTPLINYWLSPLLLIFFYNHGNIHYNSFHNINKKKVNQYGLIFFLMMNQLFRLE